MAKRGRPTDYTDALGDEICSLIADGTSAKQTCDRVGISRPTLYRWLREHESFHSNYMRAREDAADTLADELMDIAETEEDVARAKVKIDARKWVAARMKPKSWGDRQQHEHSGPDGSPLAINIVRYGDHSDS